MSGTLGTKTASRFPTRRWVIIGVAAAATLGIAAAVVAGFAISQREPAQWELDAFRNGIDAEWESIEDRYPGTPRPAVEFERFISDDEYAQVAIECLESRGVQADSDAFGPYIRGEADELERVLAWFECDTKYPLQLVRNQSYVPSLMRETYRYFGEELVPCLEARGFEIGELPSFSDLRKRWWTEDTWSPYNYVELASGAEFEELTRECPPMPTTD